MKKLLTVVILMAAAPVWAAGTAITDDYDGGFDLSYTVMTDGVSNYASSGNQLSLTGGWPPVGYGGTGATFIGILPLNGASPYVYGNTYVGLDVNLNTSKPNNDMGVAFCVQGSGANFAMYGVNYDPYYDKIQLVAITVQSGVLNYINLRGHGMSNPAVEQSVRVVAQAVAVDATHVKLVAQAWTIGGTPTLLGEDVFLVGTDQPDDEDVAPGDVPVLLGGAVGPFAAVNQDDLGPIDALSDNFIARTGIDADVDLSGTVDLTDLTIMSGSWGETSGATWSDGDVNLDGAVDLTDLTMLSGNWGGTSAAPAAGFVPEPTTMGLLAIGGLGVLLRRKRK